MNKDEFVAEVAKRKGISRRQAYRYVNDVMDTVRTVLIQGKEIELGGFGRFTVMTALRGESFPVLQAREVFLMIMDEKNK